MTGSVKATTAAGRSEAESEAAGRIVFVTGVSGAGKSSTLKALEDLGYEAVDNLPLSLLAGLVEAGDGPGRRLAIGIDIRTRDFHASDVLERLDALARGDGADVQLLFLDCDEEVLSRRFTATRRRHPLAQDRPVSDGIVHERQLVQPLHRRADVVIDTSNLSPGNLRLVLQSHFGSDPEVALNLFITSFSYNHGLPREADLVFDVRFLVNPHYDADLTTLTGRDSAVGDYIAADPAFAPFLDGLCTLLSTLLPRFEVEGKNYLNIAIGCTGGRHRSVVVAERLAAWLGGLGRPVRLYHRDIDKAAGG